MEATVDRYVDHTLVSLRGELDLYNASRLREIITAESMQGSAALLINLTDVSFIDSSGIGALIHGKGLFQKSGRVFALCSLQPSTQAVFRMTRLEAFFKIFADEETAVRELELSREPARGAATEASL